jgi:hypothetical protein
MKYGKHNELSDSEMMMMCVNQKFGTIVGLNVISENEIVSL